MYINRTAEKVVMKMVSTFKVIVVTGPRQVGKSTMLKHLLSNGYSYVTLDDINELNVAKSDPKLFFLNNPGRIIIDEIQEAPELFGEIKRIVDMSNEMGRIILTGSQTFSLMRNISESLAGRAGILELNSLSLREIRNEEIPFPFVPNSEYFTLNRTKTGIEELWSIIHRGSMPELYRNTEMDWQLFYSSYTKTYLERDVRTILGVKDLNTFSKFLVSLAAKTSQLLNYSAISNDIGVDVKTVQSWVSVLETSGIISIIQPFSNNHLSRAIKTPTVYFMDAGFVCYLLRWLTPETLKNGAMSGQILKTYVVSEIIKSFKSNGVINVPIHFYRDKDMKEIDIIIEDSGVLYPVEVKKTATPRVEMAKHLSILERAVGYTVGQKVMLCLVDKKFYIDEKIIAYPITQI